jgi:hydroxyacylglutathione hydrolase
MKMLLKYFYDPLLAHASYMVGCQRSGEAIIVDPGRIVDEYLDAAARENLKIVGVAETHIHADYVSGARELAERVGAKLYVSDEGPDEWKFEYAAEYPHQLLRDGDKFSVGNIVFETMYTPGHTPESVCFILTDQGGGADQPMGIFTGDFVFVGAIGRPDLLEEAAGVKGSAMFGAKELYHSIERFKSLPDYLQIWPSHGAGSACGKGLGAIPSSTVGYEKRFNPGLQFDHEGDFVRYILADQPEAPKYFAEMKRVNRVGPALLGEINVPKLNVATLKEEASHVQIVDCSSTEHFSSGFVPGSINIPTKSIATWGGWLIDYERPLYLICQAGEALRIAKVLYKMGVDNIAGYWDASEVATSGQRTARYPVATAAEMADKVKSGEVELIDVRALSEWNEGHIPQASHQFLGKLKQKAASLIGDKPILVQCRSGSRSAIGASVLLAAGAKEVINLKGGFLGWKSENLPTTGHCKGPACSI